MHGVPEGTWLGLDLSLTGTGICLIKGGVERLIEIDGSKLRGPKRLIAIRDIILETINGSWIDAVAIEGYAYGATGNAHSIGELGGVVRVALHEACVVEPMIVPPATLKVFATGSGKAGKVGVALAVAKRYGIEADTDNKADAAALAVFAAFAKTRDAGMPEFQVNAIERAIDKETRDGKGRKGR